MTDAAIGQITTTAGQVVIAVIALVSAVMMRRMDLRQKEQADRQAIRDRNQAIRDRKTITKVNRVRMDIANVKEAAVATATGVADVLASATNASNDRLDAIHGLVNSNMGTQLRLTMVVSRRLADLTGDPVDVAAANAAARLYAEHQQKQADADFQQGPAPPRGAPAVMSHRRPWGRLLTFKGGPRMAAAALDPAEAEALLPVVIAAVARFNSLEPRLFDVDTFAGAVRDAYQLRRFPTPGWCEGVLERLPCVARVDGHRTWKYTGDWP